MVLDALQEASGTSSEVTAECSDQPVAMDATTVEIQTAGHGATTPMLEAAPILSQRNAKTQVKPKLKSKCELLYKPIVSYQRQILLRHICTYDSNPNRLYTCKYS